MMRLTPAQLEAYYAGLSVAGDPEALEDIGIPVSPEGLDEHIMSSQRFVEAINAWPLNEAISSRPFCGDCLAYVSVGRQCPGGHLIVRAAGVEVFG